MSARKSLTRKGISRSMVIFLVIMLITIIIVFALFTKWSKATDYMAKKEMCKNSVYLNAISKMGGKEYFRLSPDIKCQTNFLTLNYNPNTPVGETAIKITIADLMADTWEVFGEGKLDLFRGPEIYCVVYSVIEFDEKYKDKEVTGLTEFLMTQKKPNTAITYMDYLHARSESDSLNLLEKIKSQKQINLEGQKIELSKKYATIFMYAKGRNYVKEMTETVSNMASSKGNIILIAGGAALFTSGLVLDATIIGLPLGAALHSVGATMVTIGTAWTMLETYIKTDEEVEWASFVVFREYNKEELDKLNCTNFPVVQGYRPQ